MGFPLRQTTRRYEWTARDADELARKVGSLTVEAGSYGRFEVYAARVFGACPVPLGPLMSLPGSGNLLSSQFTPAGAEVTDRGGLGICDAYVDWAIPTTMQQGPPGVTMGFPFAVVAVVGALALALVALGWAGSQVKLVLYALVGDPDDPNDDGALGDLKFWAFAGLGVLGLALLAPGRR